MLRVDRKTGRGTEDITRERIKGRAMKPFLLVAGLLLGLLSATANQSVFGAESWGQARQPGWGDQPVYFDGYETSRSQLDLGSHDRDDLAGHGGWSESSTAPSPWGEGSGPSSPQPEYRFRGDPQPWSGRGSGYEETAGYRFRPLTDQEAEQRAQTPGWRPLESDRDGRSGRDRPPAGLMDALTPPPRTFGFEPAPWP